MLVTDTEQKGCSDGGGDNLEFWHDGLWTITIAETLQILYCRLQWEYMVMKLLLI